MHGVRHDVYPKLTESRRDYCHPEVHTKRTASRIQWNMSSGKPAQRRYTGNPIRSDVGNWANPYCIFHPVSLNVSLDVECRAMSDQIRVRHKKRVEIVGGDYSVQLGLCKRPSGPANARDPSPSQVHVHFTAYYCTVQW